MRNDESTTPQAERKRQSEFEEAQERCLAAATEKVLERLRQCVKPDYEHRVLTRALDIVTADDEAPDQGAGPEPADEAPSLSESTCERIVKYYAALDRRTKLAIVALTELDGMEGLNFQIRWPKEERLQERIWKDLKASCADPFDNPEDAWVATVWRTCDMIQQGT